MEEEVTLEDVQKFFELLGFKWDFKYEDAPAKLSRGLIKPKIAKSFNDIYDQLKEYLVVTINGNQFNSLYVRVSKTEFCQCGRPNSYCPVGGWIVKDYSEEWNEFINSKNLTLNI